MPKSGEQFDFSKLKDQQKFEKLPEKKREKYIETQMEEAYEVKEKAHFIDSVRGYWNTSMDSAASFQDAQEFHKKALDKIDKKEAKDIKEANLMTSREYAKNLENKIDKDSCVASIWLKLNKQPTQVGMALSYMPLKESFEYTNNLIEKIEKNLEECCSGEGSNYRLRETMVNAFFDIKVKTPKDLEDFLGSQLKEFVSEDKFLSKAASEKFGPEVAKDLISRMPKSALRYVNLFGKYGLLDGFEKKEKEIILIDVMDSIEHTVKQKQDELDKDLYYHRNLSLGEGMIWERFRHLGDALKAGIVLSDYQERLKKISDTIDKSTYNNDSGYVSVRSDRDEFRAKLAKLESKMDEISGKKERVSGKGLEIVKSKAGGLVIAYLDGELIGSLEQARFSKKPTNGEVVAWLRYEVMDRDRITGVQDKYMIWAWKKGMKQPEEIYEIHKWSTEGDYSVSVPEVEKNGTIKFLIVEEGEKKEKSLKV